MLVTWSTGLVEFTDKPGKAHSDSSKRQMVCVKGHTSHEDDH